MLKINTDFKALRPEGAESPVKAPVVTGAPSAPTGPVDQADLSARHQAIIQANRAASQSSVRDLESARAASRNVRDAIAGAQQQAFMSHEALSPERVRTLLE